MKRRSAVIALSVASVMLGGVGGASAAPPPTASVRDAAVQLAHDYDTFYNEKNAAAMADLYAVDGVLVSPGGKIVTGRAALLQYYRSRFVSGAVGHKITVLQASPLGDAGYSISAFSVSAPNPPPATGTRAVHGHIASVYEHDASGWHFALVEPSVTP